MLPKSSKKKKRLYHSLNIIFMLIIILPLAVFFYFGNKYDFLHDQYIKPLMAGILIYTFAGVFFLRRIFDKIINISNEFSRKVVTELPDAAFEDGGDEIGNIVV